MKKITFKKFIIFYSLALLVLMLCFIGYVADSLVKYEDNQIDNFMGSFIEDMKDADKELNIDGLSKVKKGAFDKADASVRRGIAYLAKNDTVTFQQTDGSTDPNNPSYDIMVGEEAILRVKLATEKMTTRLGILSFNIWKIDKVQLLKEDGLFNCEISVPISCKVEVNGKKLTESDYADTSIYAGIAELGKHLEISYPVKYIVKGLTDAPEVKITGKDGKPKKYSEKGTKFAFDVASEKVADSTAAVKKIKNCPDIMQMARTWSLFMSNDLKTGKSGYNIVSEFLIDGTYLCKYAYDWATGVDIKFISIHGFANPKFSHEKVCNFEIFSDREFACDVFLQKNMIVSGNLLADKMGERMHFVYYDSTDDGENNPSWKIVGMKPVTQVAK